MAKLMELCFAFLFWWGGGGGGGGGGAKMVIKNISI